MISAIIIRRTRRIIDEKNRDIVRKTLHTLGCSTVSRMFPDRNGAAGILGAVGRHSRSNTEGKSDAAAAPRKKLLPADTQPP